MCERLLKGNEQLLNQVKRNWSGILQPDILDSQFILAYIIYAMRRLDHIFTYIFNRTGGSKNRFLIHNSLAELMIFWTKLLKFTIHIGFS